MKKPITYYETKEANIIKLKEAYLQLMADDTDWEAAELVSAYANNIKVIIKADNKRFKAFTK